MTSNATHGGARSGAGRPRAEKTKQVRIPLSLEPAVNALKNIARGDGNDHDLGEIALAVNATPTDWGRVVMQDDIDAAASYLASKIDTLRAERSETLANRWASVLSDFQRRCEQLDQDR